MLILLVLPLLIATPTRGKSKKEVAPSDSLLALLTMQKKKYDAENEKAYLKQKYDTIAMFSTLRQMFITAAKLDSIEEKAVKMKTDGQRVKYRVHNAEMLNAYRRNLYVAGQFYMNRQDYRNARLYFEFYIDSESFPLFSAQNYATTDSLMAEASQRALVAAAELHDTESIIAHSHLALKAGEREQTLRLLYGAYRELRDEDNMRRILTYGLVEFPNSVFFRYAKSLQDLHDGNLDNVIAISDTLIKEHPEQPEPYYAAGVACLKKIDRLSTKQKKMRKELYQQARIYLEKYRELSPQQQQRWAPLLYRTYYNLNLGTQFREIEKLLTK